MDDEGLRAASLEQWTHSASGWARHAARVDAHAQPVTDRMLAASAPASGDDVLEVACGTAGPGLAAAELVGPGGNVLLSDFSPAMVEAARLRARQEGIANVAFRVLDAEQLDIEDETADVVLCRFGLMLMVDPARALKEMSRVCAPGGRVVVAVWGSEEANPWASLPMRALMHRLGAPPPDPSTPGMFALSEPSRLLELLEGAGLRSVSVTEVPGAQDHPSFDSWWDETCDLTAAFRSLVEALDPSAREELRADLRATSAAFEREGGLHLPTLALVALAER